MLGARFDCRLRTNVLLENFLLVPGLNTQLLSLECLGTIHQPFPTWNQRVQILSSGQGAHNLAHYLYSNQIVYFKDSSVVKRARLA